jgi:splicing factor 3B subunit 3
MMTIHHNTFSFAHIYVYVLFLCVQVDLSDSTYTAAETAANIVHKYLTFYELDLGLNHVTRKISELVDDTSSLLLSVPGGESGPGGVVICAENRLYYRGIDGRILQLTYPRRFGLDTTEKGCMMETHTIHVQKGLFFILIQSEYGDIYKLSFTYEEDTVDEISLKYFDTIPLSSSLVVLKTGFLFTASQSANSYLYQFQGISEDDDVSAQSSSKTPDEISIFKPRQLTNLVLVDEIEQAAPILDMKVADLAKEYTPQVYTVNKTKQSNHIQQWNHSSSIFLISFFLSFLSVCFAFSYVVKDLVPHFVYFVMV